MLMILLSILTVIRHLICGNNLNWLLNMNLIYETLWTGIRSGLLISVQGKLSWFHLTALWQQLELASEHESDLRDTVDWDKKWLVDFSAGKTQPVSFD